MCWYTGRVTLGVYVWLLIIIYNYLNHLRNYITVIHDKYNYFDDNYLNDLFQPYSVNGNMDVFLLFSRHCLSPQHSYSLVAFIVCCFGSIPQFLALSLSPISCLPLLTHLLFFSCSSATFFQFSHFWSSVAHCRCRRECHLCVGVRSRRGVLLELFPEQCWWGNKRQMEKLPSHTLRLIPFTSCF